MLWRTGIRRRWTLTYAAVGCWLALAAIAPAPAQAQEEVTIYRDDFGTPHVFAATSEGACFGHGYAQATDLLEELLKQYLRATGTMSEAFGPGTARDNGEVAHRANGLAGKDRSISGARGSGRESEVA